MTTTRRTLTAAAVITAATLALGACGSSKPAEPAASPSSAATTAEPTQAPSATASSVPTVPGYRPGEIPPIPAFAVPPIDVFASNADKAVIQTASSLSSVPGVTVTPAKCDGNALVSGSTVLGGDGAGVTTNSSGTVVNGGDGSGVITQGPISIVYGGDGTGVYSNADTGLSINVNEDGSGVYSTPTLSINLDGMGGGNYTDSSKTISIINNGDGSGNYSTATVSIINNGDGSGSYSDSTMTIRNNGDGTAVVNGTTVTDAPKVDKVSKLGKFPPIASLQPVESCGTLITLEDGVLFDFGKSDIRPEAAATLKNLAEVLTNAKVPLAHIYGHTDSIGDDASNQTLSEERAAAVVSELKKDGVTATLDSQGFGESKPVAPNTNADGSDNPAGRQANRRVEIFIPAF